MRGILIAGTGSGCGKTTITCGILGAMMRRKLKIAGFKCGPDYIDPMFHSRILGIDTGNLDSFLMDDSTIKYLFHKNSCRADISVLEGVMGYYDGQGIKDVGSTYSIAKCLGVPVILVVNAKGMGRSVLATIKGFVLYKSDSNIKAVIFNQLPARLYPEIKQECEQMGLLVLGNFPAIHEAEIKSRHLGLVTAAELSDFKYKMELLADATERYIDLDKLIKLSEMKGDESGAKNSCVCEEIIKTKQNGGIRIAVAKDDAFCFYYKDNLELLKELGCELVEFSPIYDKEVPEAEGLILGGGYPELYAKQLSENATMLRSIKQRIENNLVTHAECGGFMYLHDSIMTPEGNEYSMAGVFHGRCSFTDRLQHFGYVNMNAVENSPFFNKGFSLKAHEFHRSISDLDANVFCTKKGNETWGSYVKTMNTIAGFPHIHYYSNVQFAVNFVKACRENMK